MNFDMANVSVQQHISEIRDQVTQTRGCRVGRRARRDWFRRSDWAV
jgi:hypothetical protein